MKNSIKTNISYVLLSLCTYCRPNIFGKCLESIAALNLPEGIKVELLVIDNDANGSAKETVNEFTNLIKIPIHYVIEEKRGLSNARNRQLNEAVILGASHIAMFDDDIILPENWLLNCINYYNTNEQAVIVTAASYAKFTSKPPKYIEKNDLFKCSTTKKTGSVRATAASGNVFFPTSLITDLKLNFSSEYVFMGGEDGRFFEEASENGAVIVWCNDCFNWELNGVDKINIKWILNRSFHNGYSAAQNTMKRNTNLFKKSVYRICQLLSFFMNCCLLPFSLFFGITVFINMLGFTVKSFGRLKGSVQNIPLNYYEKIYGD